MQRLSLLISLLVVTMPVFGQTSNPDPFELGITTGYSYSKSHFVQLGAMWGRNYGNVHIPSEGFGVGADIGSVNDKLTVGAKAFYEYNPFIITSLRINAINYFRGSTVDFRILPEVGLTAFGNLSLMYGYGLPIIKNELTGISRHRFSITLNLFRKKNNRLPITTE